MAGQLQHSGSPRGGTAQDRVAAARAAIAENPVWYHTLELAPGVLTPGHIDLRNTAGKLLPDDLSGKRALDVGTFDGFWAFEMEKRGAEVVAIDLEVVDDAQLPPNNRAALQQAARDLGIEYGRGFRLARELLGYRAERIVCDVLALTPEAIGGSVDVVFLGALLVHLRDPVQALENIFNTLVPGGELYQLEVFSPRLTVQHPRKPVAHLRTLETKYNWWTANWATLKAWLRTAGFVDIRGLGAHHPPNIAMPNWYRGIVSRRPS